MNILFVQLKLNILDFSTLEEESCDSDDDDLDNLVNKFQKLSAKNGTYRICQPKLEQTVCICFVFVCLHMYLLFLLLEYLYFK